MCVVADLYQRQEKGEAHLRDKCCAEEKITALLFLSCKAL